MITKQWTGFTREVFTSAANFGIRCEDNININLFGQLFMSAATKNCYKMM